MFYCAKEYTFFMIHKLFHNILCLTCNSSFFILYILAYFAYFLYLCAKLHDIFRLNFMGLTWI